MPTKIQSEPEYGLSPRTLSSSTAGDGFRHPLDMTAMSGRDVVRRLINTPALNQISGAEVLRTVDPLSGGLLSQVLNRIAGKTNICCIKLFSHQKKKYIQTFVQRFNYFSYLLKDQTLMQSIDRISGSQLLRYFPYSCISI